jgi:hypothetical protein
MAGRPVPFVSNDPDPLGLYLHCRIIVSGVAAPPLLIVSKMLDVLPKCPRQVPRTTHPSDVSLVLFVFMADYRQHIRRLPVAHIDSSRLQIRPDNPVYVECAHEKR